MPEPVDGRHRVTVAIVARQRVVRAGLVFWLRSAQPDIVVAGCFDGAAALTSAHPTAAAGRVVVVDVPCARGGADLAELRSICVAGHRVVAYTCRSGDDTTGASRAAGASRCVGRDEPTSALVAAIRAASRGCSPPPEPAVGGGVADTTVRPRLSLRERQVLLAWFRTENKHAVADLLYIEPTTVATHLQRVRAKYAAVGRPATTKAALVARAIQDEILSVDDL